MGSLVCALYLLLHFSAEYFSVGGIATDCSLSELDLCMLKDVSYHRRRYRACSSMRSTKFKPSSNQGD